ncbi:unnamed protein product [Rhizophagus irregularis]|nr:unnamed protein product [Rhizophagus irregularis]
MRQQTTVGQSKKKQSSIPVASKTTKVRPKVPCNCKKCNAIDHEFYLIDEEQYNTNMESMYDARRKRQQIFDQSLIPEVDQQSNDVKKRGINFLTQQKLINNIVMKIFCRLMI